MYLIKFKSKIEFISVKMFEFTSILTSKQVSHKTSCSEPYQLLLGFQKMELRSSMCAARLSRLPCDHQEPYKSFSGHDRARLDLRRLDLNPYSGLGVKWTTTTDSRSFNQREFKSLDEDCDFTLNR